MKGEKEVRGDEGGGGGGERVQSRVPPRTSIWGQGEYPGDDKLSNETVRHSGNRMPTVNGNKPRPRVATGEPTTTHGL